MLGWAWQAIAIIILPKLAGMSCWALHKFCNANHKVPSNYCWVQDIIKLVSIIINVDLRISCIHGVSYPCCNSPKPSYSSILSICSIPELIAGQCCIIWSKSNVTNCTPVAIQIDLQTSSRRKNVGRVYEPQSALIMFTYTTQCHTS